ncbi:methyltransferase family protein [Pseudoduganella flava]|uniref:Methyltransferase domain-containing protein n=1 Tax=Pseudoduganella flava TaxID=871742 RepID=A0A562PLX4_9BURK|nr:class I SAM-dependent methyltransferase [Pseudoduganella flava]QGZ40942.1 methyltransferase domain-containing protein [Pseudoduganella flava]TWI45378.1 methyltransferase family protein [Pseudoduganella flava]
MEANDNPQAALWNGSAGAAWVDNQDLLEALFRPFEPLLAAAIAPGAQVLDVGCGTGSTTLAIARQLAGTGHATGLDISEAMIDTARATAARLDIDATFLCADAERHPFAPDSLDAIVSRFGVMFFADPVAAFANLRRAARPGATLHLYAWRDAAENPFMTAAERAVAHLVPLPERDPDEPGQFAFARRQRVEGILHDSGWQDVTIAPADVRCSMPLVALPRYVSRMGPLGRILPTLDEASRARIVEEACAGFAPHVQGEAVMFTAACWEIRARNG